MLGLALSTMSVNQQSKFIRSSSDKDWNQRAFASGVSSCQSWEIEPLMMHLTIQCMGNFSLSTYSYYSANKSKCKVL